MSGRERGAVFTTCIQVLTVFIMTVALCNSSMWHSPQQVHIAVGETIDQMTIMWSTFNDTDDTSVLYGTNSNVTAIAVGTRKRFDDPGPEKRFQFINKVVLSGLSPKTVYYYRVGSKTYGYSDIYTFTTWPKGEDWSPSILLFGDLGKDNAQSLPRMELDNQKDMYDAVLHVGDFAYDLFADNSRVGDEFMRMIEPLSSKLPYMTCPGNHEIQYNFSNYKNIFSMPGDVFERNYYSFTMGPIRFISINTELIFTPQFGLVRIVEHYKWVERVLAEANKPENRAKQPWIVTYGHRPMYCSNDNNDDCTHHESLTRVGIPFVHILGLEPLYHKYGVDLALWAHEHSYERLWPVFNREVKNGSYEFPYTNPGGPVHIVTGSAGCRERHDNFDRKVDPWSAFRSDDYGFTRMKVFNKTHMYIEQVSDDQAGRVIDSFYIIKDNHTSYGHDTPEVKPVSDPLKKLWHIWKDHAADMMKLL